MSLARKRIVAFVALISMLSIILALPGSAKAFSGSGSGTADDPYIIRTPAQLNEVRNDLHAHYKLGNDIDMSSYGPFVTIGRSGGLVWPFCGTFNGDWYTISGLTINSPGEEYVGLFGSVEWEGVVENLRLVGVNITGAESVGGLTGSMRYGGHVRRVFVQGTVTSGSHYAGGIAGYMGMNATSAFISEAVANVNVTGAGFCIGGLAAVNSSLCVITDSYALGSANTTYRTAGGLIGANDGSVISSYAVGQVTGPAPLGGLVGSSYVDIPGSCYWDAQTTGQATSPRGGTAKNTAEMMQAATFSGWDFTNVWAIAEGTSYPFLRWETRPVMRGAVGITGVAQYGATLTADVSGLTYTEPAPGNVLTYQWKRAGAAIAGANVSAYTLSAADVGQTITVSVIADGANAQGSVTSAASAAVAKASAATPAAPTLSTVTHRTVTLVANADHEFRMDGGAWQDSNVFAGLSSLSAHTFTARVRETATHNPSSESVGLSVTTTATPVIGGSVTISGDARFGQPLTADISGVAYTPDSTDDVPTYQWNRGGVAIVGATGLTYTLAQADIGQMIAVVVTADGINATGSITSAATASVAKAAVVAPAAPTLASVTHNSVTLTANAAHEYQMDGGTWQVSSVFTGLSPLSAHTFTARVRETATHDPSSESAALNVTTTATPVIGGSVTITGDVRFGQMLTADVSGVTYAPSTTADSPTYQWKRGGVAIVGATGLTYTLMQTDIGQTITVAVTADGINATGSITSAATASVTKAAVAAPVAPTLASVTHNSVTLTANDANEYQMDGGAWQDSSVFTGLSPLSAHTFTARVRETATHGPSSGSAALNVTTTATPVIGGIVTIAGDVRFGQMLTADVSGVTYAPSATADSPTYQWQRGVVAIVGATGLTYTLTQADIGQTIMFTVAADEINATGCVASASTAVVEKIDGPAAPDAPTLVSTAPSTVRLAGVAAQEYSRDGGAAWQDDAVFTGLQANRSYTFVTRVKETPTQKASATSEGLTVTTLPEADAAPGLTMLELLIEGDSVAGGAGVYYDVVAATAWTSIGSPFFDQILAATEADGHGRRVAAVRIPPMAGVTSFTIGLTSESLSATGDARLVIHTPVGSVGVPSNMLVGTEHLGSGTVSVTMGLGDKAALPESVREAIGTRPLISLGFAIDGEPQEWENPDAPVTVTIPYAPTAAELANPEHITVWYVDGSGRVTSVPSGRYDPQTATVTFTTTHFSHYAVAYVHKTFADLAGVAWASESVETLASKGIVDGTSESTFSPSAAITRADFLVLLVRTLGLTARDVGAFADVLPSDYYHDEVGIAKTLGVTNGVDGSRFDPGSRITRQDMLVLTARALALSEKMALQGSGADLAAFTDADTIAPYAVESVASLVAGRLLVGDAGRINPYGDTTRAEAAVLLYRVYNLGR